MTEDEARSWIATRFGGVRETALSTFVNALTAEAAHQNLVSASSLGSIWSRHIVDSAQLIRLAGPGEGHWVDIGTGAGFPGLVVGILSDRSVTLIEPRRKRADFLQSMVDMLNLADRIDVRCDRVEKYSGSSAAVISARAVAGLPQILAAGCHLSTKNTIWILPKGPRATEEVAVAQRTWHGVFHVEQSITDHKSFIITAKGVARR